MVAEDPRKLETGQTVVGLKIVRLYEDQPEADRKANPDHQLSSESIDRLNCRDRWECPLPRNRAACLAS